MPLVSLENQKTLKELARQSIDYGVQYHKEIQLQTNHFENELLIERATFVTLEMAGDLRGCIGELVATQPLALSVASNAYKAAFCDPRFMPVQKNEVDLLDIKISILSQPTEINFSSEEDLLQKLQVNIDGLILKSGFHTGTFLPSVWEELHTPQEFFEHLKLKAGLPAGYWDHNIKVFRYTTECF